MATTLISSKKSSNGSPYAYYTFTASAGSRTANSIKITITAKGHLQYAESFLGTGHTLVAGVYVNGSWHTATLKSSSSSWSGTSNHSKTYSFNITGLSSTATSITISKVRVLNTGSGSQAQLNATTVDKKISFSAYSSGSSSTTTPVATTPQIVESEIVLNSSAWLTINLPIDKPTYSHTVDLSFGNYTKNLATKEVNLIQINEDLGQYRDALLQQIPDAADGICTITCKTYNGSTLIGTKYDTVILSCPEYEVQGVDSVSVYSNTSTYTDVNKMYINYTLSNWQAKYFETLQEVKLFFRNTSTLSEYSSGRALPAGTYQAVAVVVDTRGFSSAEKISSTFTVQSYIIPTIVISDLVNDDTKISLKTMYTTSLPATISFVYKPTGSTEDYKAFIGDINVSSNGTYTATKTLANIANDWGSASLFEFKVVINDGLTAPSAILKQGTIILSRRSDGIAFGKRATQAGLECDYAAQFNKPIHMKGVLTSDTNATFGGDIEANRAFINGNCYINNHVNPIGYTLSGSNTVNIASGTTGKALSDEISLGAGTWVCIANVRYKTMGGKTAMVQWYADTPSTDGYGAVGAARNQAAAPADLSIQATLLYQCDSPFKVRVYGWQNSGSTLKDVSVYWRAVRIA